MKSVVSNLINKNGNATANQFVINYYDIPTGQPFVAFQSYSSRVCEIANISGKTVVTFGHDWDYSRTTTKHLTTFLEDFGCSALNNTNTIRKAIKKGYINEITVLYDDTME